MASNKGKAFRICLYSQENTKQLSFIHISYSQFAGVQLEVPFYGVFIF